MAALSLGNAVLYLKENYPDVAISYPTALKYIRLGYLRAIRVGKTYKIGLDELNRFATQGNYVAPQLQIAPSTYSFPMNVPKVIPTDEFEPTT